VLSKETAIILPKLSLDTQNLAYQKMHENGALTGRADGKYK